MSHEEEKNKKYMNKNNIFLALIVGIGLLFVLGSSSDMNIPCESDSFDNCKVLDYLTGVGTGDYPNSTTIHKFGASTIDTTPHIISISEQYRTPTTPQSLEFVSDNAADTFLGLGAREITIQGLNSSWLEETVIIQTNGTTPVQLPIQFLRVYRWWVSSSGTYAATGTASYQGNLVIQGTGGGLLWTTILNSPITTGQSQIGVYTVEKGKTAYLLSKSIFIDTTRPTDIYFFFRENADDVTAPFNGTRRIIEREIGVAGGHSVQFQIPKRVCVGPCDIGMFGVVAQGTGEASIEFELLLVDTIE